MLSASRRSFAALALAAALWTLVGGIGPRPAMADDKDLAQALRTGGLVIVLRHGATFADQTDAKPIASQWILRRVAGNVSYQDFGRAPVLEWNQLASGVYKIQGSSHATVVIEMGDHLVVAHTTHVRGRDGVEAQARTFWLITIRDGKMERGCLYQDKQEALEAVGLSEQDARADSS